MFAILVPPQTFIFTAYLSISVTFLAIAPLTWLEIPRVPFPVSQEHFILKQRLRGYRGKVLKRLIMGLHISLEKKKASKTEQTKTKTKKKRQKEMLGSIVLKIQVKWLPQQNWQCMCIFACFSVWYVTWVENGRCFKLPVLYFALYPILHKNTHNTITNKIYTKSNNSKQTNKNLPPL